MSVINTPAAEQEKNPQTPAVEVKTEVSDVKQTVTESVSGGPNASLPKKKKKTKIKHKILRWLIPLVILALVIFGLARFLGGGKEGEQKVVTDTVQYGSITSTVKGSGLTKAKNSETITLTTSGTVQEVFVEEGQKVTTGERLFMIDSPAAHKAVQSAKTTLDGYEKQMKTLKKDIAGLNLKADYDGKIIEVVKLEPGDEISKGTTVAKLIDDTRLRLKQYYSYAYEGNIKKGQTVSVSIPSLMTEIDGTVEAVHMVDRITPEGSKLFEVEIVVENPGTLVADMIASATLSDGTNPIYPYESGVLENYRSCELNTTVTGEVISSNLVDYMSVKGGQVLVRINGDDTENEIFDLQQNIDEAREKLETEQENLDHMNATAPIDGTVIGLGISVGDEVDANTAVVTVSDTSTLLVDATVDERNIAYVKPDMMVDLDQWGNMGMGMVESVSLNSTQDNGVASYPMVISMDNQDGAFMTGSNVTYTLVASENDNCLVLPLQCVKYVPMEDGSTGTVVFVEGERPENAIDLEVPVEGVPENFWAVPVEIGISDSTNVEIKSGVEEGAVVFTQIQTTNGSSWM